MRGVVHFVLSDCVSRRLAPGVSRALPADVQVGHALRDVNCKDCRRQVEQIADKWLGQYQTRLTPLQQEVRRNADTIAYQLELIGKLQAVINGASNESVPHAGRGDRCPTCSRGALLPRYFRGVQILACDQFPRCDYHTSMRAPHG